MGRVEDAQLNSNLIAVLLGGIIYLTGAQLLGIHAPKRIFDFARNIRRAMALVALCFLILVALGFVLKVSSSYSRLWFSLWAAGVFFGILALRIGLGSLYEARMAAGGALQRAGILSFEGDPDDLAADLTVATGNRVRASAFLSYRGRGPISPALLPLVRGLPIDTLIIQASQASIAQAVRSTWSLRNLALDIHVAVALPGEGIEFVRAEQLGSQLLLQVGERPLSGWNVAVKRVEDIVVAVVALIVFAPLMAVIAAAVKLDSPGPVIFRQRRVGFNQEVIEAWKFRSMYHHLSDRDAVRQTERGDPRVTRVGRFLRSTSLDELPQFFNVLQGTMAVVGPRPHALGTRAADMALEEVIDDYAARHRVKPGITGWAQVNGLRGPLDTAQKARLRVEYDLEYVARWSIWLDLRIMAMTLITFLRDPRAF